MNRVAAPPRAAAPDDAAVRGAELAFGKRLAVPSPGSSSSSLPLSESPPAPLSRLRKSTSHSEHGRRSRAAGHLTPAAAASVGIRSRTLSPPKLAASAAGVEPNSPSFIAATLAASRNPSPGPKASRPAHKASVGAVAGIADFGIDAGPIAPTGALISLFDRSHRLGPAPPNPGPGPLEAQRIAVDRFMAAPPRSLPKPAKPSPKPLPPVVRREKPPALAVAPEKPPTTPSTHRRPAPPPEARPRPRRASHGPTSPIDPRARPKPGPGVAVSAPRRSMAQSPSPRLPKRQVTKPPPPKPLVVRPPIVRSTTEVLSPKPMRLVTPNLTRKVALSPQHSRPNLAPGILSSPSPDPQKRSLAAAA
ncbi:hypothetical protein CDD83_6675 [Cordyceps sp. RAO-2017]|nr:hypothetical protein CDD83_6675 [Cordyceps sp. RAO-2017]